MGVAAIYAIKVRFKNFLIFKWNVQMKKKIIYVLVQQFKIVKFAILMDHFVCNVSKDII